MLHLREGDIEVSETQPGLWVVSWYPHREDHPDFPVSTTDSNREQMPIDGGAEAIVEWARDRFDTHDPRIMAEIIVEEGAPEEELRRLQAIFDEAGAPAVITAGYGRRSAELLPWVMLIKAPLGAFLMAIATKAGSDAWDALKVLVKRVYAERRRPGHRDGTIRLDDEALTVILTLDLPDRAYKQLADGEFPATGYFLWDDASGSWRRY